MEVRNNTPSFGMAFIKPAAKDMPEFTKYIVKGRRPKLVSRGLKQMQKQHASDKHVDIVFMPEKKGFAVVPKELSQASVKEVIGASSAEFVDVTRPRKLDLISAEFEEKMAKLDEAKAGKLKQLWAGTVGVCKMLKEVGRVMIFSPKEVLPGSLLAASEEASRIEKAVDKNLAKAAAKIQRQAENEKLINNALK